MTTTRENRQTDAEARLNLPKSFANTTVIIEKISASEIRIRKARIIPEDEARFCEESRVPLSDRDGDVFLKLLANPPEPNDALKNAAAQRKARHG